jgi:outer membrane lipoprotein SlyB
MKRLIFGIALAVMLAGCASLSPNDYSTDEGMQVAATLTGVVVSVRDVQTHDSGTTEAGYGALLGAVAFHGIGSGATRLLATLVGAGAGAATGKVMTTSLSRQAGKEIIVRVPFSTGNRLITIVQGDDLAFTKGERVHVIETSSHSVFSGDSARWRVVPAG